MDNPPDSNSFFTLPLRPLVEKDADVHRKKKDMLPIRIAQINAQRGSFRNITEQSLQDEINAQRERRRRGEDEEEEEENVEAKKSADLDATERHETLYKRRAEIMQFAVQAHMEAIFALDFISLLLSKHAPRSAETSISPHLKQMVPLGSLNVDVIKTPEKPSSTQQDISTVARGWKLESFDAAANKLLKAASRLESEVAAETKYWSEVLAVKEKGWKVCRLPRERQALGVQYGFLEATSTFRDQGLASLRRADDGSLVLDRGLAPSRPRAVRVRIKKNNQITGSSKLSQFIAHTADDESIENRLVQARDILYEEELFHELTREARTLVSSGVTTRRNLIQFEFNDGEEILFDLVDMDNAPDESDVVHQTEEHNTLAEAAAHAIRILLSYSHRQNLLRRRQIPPPLTTKKRPLPEYHLLRPVLAYLQHNAHIQSLQSFLRDIYLVLESAGIKSEYTAAPFASLALLSSYKDEPLSPSASTHIDTLVHNFLEPLESQFSGAMANHQSSTFATKIRTNLSGPSLGTEYEFSIRLPNFPHTQPPSRIGLREEVENVITHLILLDLTTFISSISKKKKSSNSNSNAKVEQQSDKQSKTLIWEAPFAHHGELVALSPSTQRSKKLSLHLSRTEFTIRASWLGGEESLSSSSSSSSSEDVDVDDGKSQTQTQTQAQTQIQTQRRTGKILYSWTLDDAEKEKQHGTKKRTLEDVIVEVSNDDVEVKL